MQVSGCRIQDTFAGRRRPAACIRHPESGFTLIEILVVIVIIGILAALTLVGVLSAIERSRHSSTQALVQQLHSACDSYRTRWSDYPPSTLAEFGVTMPNDTNNGIEAFTACLSSQNRGGILWQPQDVESYGNVDDDKVGTNITNWYFGDNQLREVLDFWHRPLTYIHHKDYSRANAPVAKYIFTAKGEEVTIKPAKTEKTKTFAHPDKFQITSPGKDGIHGNTDDVVNW
jgi:prepilin-type N-terminal cleavage/methylation domain-containing protein